VFPTKIDKKPELVEEDLDEAAAILNKFPRGATALMDVCIQKLVPLLENSGKELSQRVALLARKGLENGDGTSNGNSSGSSKRFNTAKPA
jgi:hypothetical protein